MRTGPVWGRFCFHIPPRDDKSFDWLWEWTYQSCYNYENMQGASFLHGMLPAIRELYADDPEETQRAMARHFEFYIIEDSTGGGVLGLVLAMEEQRASGEDIPEDSIRSVKTGLMGPLSGIGDSYMQGVLMPIVLSICCAQALAGNVAAVFVEIAVMAVAQLALGWFWFKIGYSRGSDALLDALDSGTFKNLITGAGILGCMVLGALIKNFVELSCAITIDTGGAEPFSLQAGLFDALLPGILPLAITLVCYWMLNKGWKSTHIILFLIAFAVIGNLTGILA